MGLSPEMRDRILRFQLNEITEVSHLHAVAHNR